MSAAVCCPSLRTVCLTFVGLPPHHCLCEASDAAAAAVARGAVLAAGHFVPCFVEAARTLLVDEGCNAAPDVLSSSSSSP